MEITIQEVTFSIPQVEPTTAIIIILLLSVFLVYWHFTLYPLLSKKKKHKVYKTVTHKKVHKHKKTNYKPYISNTQSQYTDYIQSCWDELNK